MARYLRHTGYTKHIAFFMVVISLMLPFVPAVQGATYDSEVRIQIDADPNAYYDTEYNLADRNKTRENICSERVYDDLSETGTYYGPLFEVGQFEMYYNYKNNPTKPEIQSYIDNYQIWDIQDITYEIEINIKPTISYDIVMNGVSEWWIDIPVRPKASERIFDVYVLLFTIHGEIRTLAEKSGKGINNHFSFGNVIHHAFEPGIFSRI